MMKSKVDYTQSEKMNICSGVKWPQPRIFCFKLTLTLICTDSYAVPNFFLFFFFWNKQIRKLLSNREYSSYLCALRKKRQ